MRKIVIYSGGFHPFGRHHLQAYQHLCEVFGKQNVYIATSDYVDEVRPLTFNEKVRVMQQYDITNVMKVKQPYKATEITSLFDPATTMVIYAVGKKDEQRINTNKYFKRYDGTEMSSYNEHGYLYILPHVSLYHDNIELSGTNIRKIISTATPEIFKDLMGWYDAGLDSLFKQKFLNEGAITKTQLLRVEQYIDKLFKQFNIDIDFQNIYKGTHFFQRLNDPRNTTPITTDELRNLFKKVSTRHGLKLSKMNPGAEAVLKDIESDINIPFILVWDRENQELDLRPKTIMKKPDFKTSSPVLAVENYNGKGRHINHPYEHGLDAEQMCQLLTDLMNNQLELIEKIDGSNLKITIKNGKIFAARNKTTLINPVTSNELYELILKSTTNPQAAQMFKQGMDAFGEYLLKNYNLNYLNSICLEGKRFFNVDIYSPVNKNIVSYGNVPFVSVHSIIEFNNGNEIATYKLPNFKENLSYNGYNIKLPTKLTTKFDTSKLEIYKNLILSNYNNSDKLKLVWWKIGSDLLNSISVNPDNRDRILRIVNLYKDQCPDTLQDLLSIGGFDAINTFEGFVFNWKNNMYKITGTFGLLRPVFNLHYYYSR
jgi:hypothetical protein